MPSKLEYFVLALYINSVASSSYYMPKISGREALNREFNSPRRNDEVYLAHDEPSYMSPIPTKSDRKLNEDIIRDTRSLRDPSRIENHSIVANYGNVGLLHQNKPVVNNFGSSSGSVNENKALKVLNQYNTNNNQQPLRIQARPEKRIAFQEAVVPDLTNLQSYHPGTPVNGFNINREWTRISSEPGNLPEWIVERLKHPVDFKNVRHQIGGASNFQFQEHHIQKILTDPRIQNVVASTKQIKRYMVIQPDGTVQHFDKLEHISAQHPDFVLLGAGQFRNKVKPEVITTENKLQEQPLQKLITLQNGSVSLDSKSSKPTDEQQAVVEKLSKTVTAVQILPSTIVEKVTSSYESPITPKPSVVSSSIITDILLPSTLEPETLLNVETSANIEKETIKQENVEIEEENVTASSNTSNTTANNSEVVDKTDENTSSILPVTKSVTTDVTTTSEVISPQGIRPTPEAEVTIIPGDASPVPSAIIVKDDINSTVQSIQNDDNIEISEASEVKDLGSTSSRRPVLLDTLDPDFWQNMTDSKDSNNVVLFLVNSEKDDSNATVQSTQNDENTETTQASEVQETSRSGKPIVFDTSDPDFWQKVSDWSDGDGVVFFFVKPGPRVEMEEEDIAKTVHPDGSVLE